MDASRVWMLSRVDTIRKRLMTTSISMRRMMARIKWPVH